MDVTAKVAALEEEVTVLKGEIKLILQELRTAILARENPFALAAPESLALPASTREERGPSNDRGAASPAPAESPVAIALEAIAKPVALRPEAKTPLQAVQMEHPRLDVTRLAALVAWTQETANTLSAGDLSIVLAMARYGGLIEGDLEATLAKIGKTANGPSNPRAGIGDLLLALRQFEALVGDERRGTDAANGRKAG
jgi:hypothetical protein